MIDFLQLSISRTRAIVFFSAALFAVGCTQVGPDSQSAVVADTGAGADVEVRKSPNDDRDYRYFVLPNKLRVLLVSDPATDKSAAALAVYRGSYHEPDNRAGLAHFLEHMLFIQTEKYPEIDGFQEFIAANGGSSNAYTASDHTNYFFDVRPEGFSEALDRFAHFFINPIISAEYADREKNAVHSEYQMQIRDDGWRANQVTRQALNPAHPARRFYIGSLETLAGDIQADLIKFFEEEYSADQMGLVAISNVSLDELEAQVRPLFGKIENKDIGSDYFAIPMYAEGQLPAILRSQTLKDGASVTFSFPLPPTRQHYRKKPEQYFANLIGHEGEGSLYQDLKARGWIDSLGTGVSEFDRGTSILNVSIDLTEAGDARLAEIKDLLFDYIDLIKSAPPKGWLYEEQARVAELGFRFQEKSNATALVYRLAPRLDEYPPADLLVAPYLMEEFDADLITEYMAALTRDNVLVEYYSPKVKGTEVEPWFSVPYSLTPGSLSETEVATANFDFPAANPFLPERLSVTPNDDAQITQQKVDGADLWWDLDTQFGTPRANVYLELTVPGGFVSAEDRAMAQLYRLIVEDSISALTYPAYLAGLGYNFGVSTTGYQINLGGYADKQLTLLERVVPALMNTSIDPERFAALKTSLIQDWQNAAKERPYSQTLAALQDSLRPERWPRPDLITALEDKTPEALTAWRDAKLKSVGLRGLLHGNVSSDLPEAVSAAIAEHANLSQVAVTDIPVRDIPSALLLEIPIEHNDSSMILHVQDADESFASRARSALASQILRPEYFRELRTEQQLGYVVAAIDRPVGRRGGLTFIVQSPVASAQQLEAATKEFFDHFLTEWEEATDASLDEHKAGLVTRLTQKPKNLGQQSQRYWADLTSGYTNFDSRERIAEEATKLTVEDMRAYFEEVAQALAERRLLIFNRGQFAEVPSDGKQLTLPTDTFTSAGD